MAGSTIATAPASHKLAPVITLTTVIAINMCPMKNITANVILDVPATFLNVFHMPFVNSVIITPKKLA
jgi:hypothetical protein